MLSIVCEFLVTLNNLTFNGYYPMNLHFYF